MGTKKSHSKQNFETFRQLLVEQLKEHQPTVAFRNAQREFSKTAPSGHPLYMVGKKMAYATSTLKKWANGYFESDVRGGPLNQIAESLLPLQQYKQKSLPVKPAESPQPGLAKLLAEMTNEVILIKQSQAEINQRLRELAQAFHDGSNSGLKTSLNRLPWLRHER